MLIDDLKEQLKKLQPDIDTINAFWQNANLEKRFQELTTQSEQANFWQNPKQIEISKELQRIRIQRDQYHYSIGAYKELDELMELFAQDEEELKKISREINKLKKTVASFKIALLLQKPEDASFCFMSINAGAGGTESQDWANMLLRMYQRFCEREGFTVSMVDYQPADEAGIKSATLYIKGENAFGLLKSEHGVHRLVRISPFDANKRRHTSFSAVTVTPEIPELNVEILPSDIRIDTYRASGAGGQHVNTTDSAVRITHIPTGIVAQCQNERSQGQNRETAMKVLRAKVAQKMLDDQNAKIAAGTQKKKIEWGSQIRSYVLHPYKMVKDHRTDYESPQPDLVLDGELMDFIEAYLVWNKS